MKVLSKEYSSCSNSYIPWQQRPLALIPPYHLTGYLCSWTVVQPEPEVQTQRGPAVHMRATVLTSYEDNEKGRRYGGPSPTMYIEVHLFILKRFGVWEISCVAKSSNCYLLLVLNT